jgi:putative transcriptional regulator
MKNNLKQLRLSKNLTQEEIANKLGVTRQTIISIESKKYVPSLPLALKIADFFNKKVEEIFILKGGE